MVKSLLWWLQCKLGSTFFITFHNVWATAKVLLDNLFQLRVASSFTTFVAEIQTGTFFTFHTLWTTYLTWSFATKEKNNSQQIVDHKQIIMGCIYDKGAFKSFGFLCLDKVCALQRTLKEVLSDIEPEDICLFYNVTVFKLASMTVRKT